MKPTWSRWVLIGLLSAALLAIAPAALADPPHGGASGHHHHVNTGNGDCKDLDAKAFNAEGRGLHQGAGASGQDNGPWHGPCLS